MSRLYRAQILLEPAQREALGAIADDTGQSVSEVLRGIVREHLARLDHEAARRARQAALEGLSTVRRNVQARHGVVASDLVAEARAEREADADRLWRGEE
jgi:hypothetical protein